MKRAIVYSIIGIVVLIFLSISAVPYRTILDVLQIDVRYTSELLVLISLFRHIETTMGFILIYTMIQKVYPSRSTFFRGLLAGVIFGLVDNGIVDHRLVLLFYEDASVFSIFESLASRCIYSFIMGQTVAFSCDQLASRFLKKASTMI